MNQYINLSKSLLLSCLVFLLACSSSTKDDVEVIKIDGLQQLLSEKEHQIHIINFWATWCAPCIKELPQFTALAIAHPEAKISLVSLDFVQNLETKVKPFLDKRKIDLRVLLIDELDYNLWIDIVDPSWSGAIPATLIIEPATGRRIFLEKELEKNELVQAYERFIKKKS
jgi:thiol-disulfide isomerase/thioredoxin